MDYTSTRNASRRVNGAQAILTGLAPDGGLFVPVNIGTINIKELLGKTYKEIALTVFEHFLPEYNHAFIKDSVNESYGQNFNNKAGHLVKVKKNLFSLELWHGPTAAFKDYALQIMPKFLSKARQLMHIKETTLILVATSGDTGSAALSGYSNLDGIKIAAFYPENGTSEIQKLQMVTQEADNVFAYGIRGNFDDAQKGVKAAFCDKELAKALLDKNIKLSSANSINWGRLCPQIVYYISSYLKLVQNGSISYGEEVDYCVPTGNFGDIMAGYYAKKLGLPIGRLICASNKNNVLSDFLSTGIYSTKREFLQTSSPSMDILVSSNLERLLYHESMDAQRVKNWMQQLSDEGEYKVSDEVMNKIKNTFDAGWASEDEVSEQIKHIFNNNNYLCDPHTAVAFAVAEKMKNNKNPLIVLSTASPFKFCGKVLSSLGQNVPENEFEALNFLENASGEKAPASLTKLKNKNIRFTDVIDSVEISEIPLKI